jgi:citrate synthase
MAADDPVLFEIHRSQLDSGLRGFPVGTCQTSAVNPDLGVSYGGYPIAELAALPSEDVIHLLVHKRLPTKDEATAFAAELRRRAAVPPKVFELLAQLPKDGHPMEWLIAGLVYLGMTGRTGDWTEDALNVIARVNGVAAAIFRLRAGWGKPIPPLDDLPYAANFAHMLGAPGAHAQLPELLRLFHVLHMDHGGGNLSTFTGKAVASSHADVYVSLAASMAALYGPLHGRANQECLDFVREVKTSDPKEVEAFVRKHVAAGGKAYGFGHAVLRAEDPRAQVQYAFAERHFANHPLVKIALCLRKVVPPILKETPKIQNPYPNVDAVSGSLLHAAGLEDSDYYTVLFGWSRVVGIAAQIVDERVRFRGGKGVPIYRPRFIAENQPPRHL